MGKPSRRSEINRRRTRTEKIAKLRKRYAEAKAEGDRTRILEKLTRVAPSMPREAFAK